MALAGDATARRREARARQALRGPTAISAVTLAELYSLARQRHDDGTLRLEARWRDELIAADTRVVLFDERQARHAGALWEAAKSFGVHLIDRCAMALAIELQWPVLTGDGPWKKVEKRVSGLWVELLG